LDGDNKYCRLGDNFCGDLLGLVAKECPLLVAEESIRRIAEEEEENEASCFRDDNEEKLECRDDDPRFSLSKNDEDRGFVRRILLLLLLLFWQSFRRNCCDTWKNRGEIALLLLLLEDVKQPSLWDKRQSGRLLVIFVSLSCC
jgi:hypothetical protein